MGERRSTRDVVPGFGPALRAARLAAGLSLADVGSRAGCGFGAVYKVETEARSPSLRLAVALAEAVGVDLWDLLRDARSAATADEPKNKSQNRD